MAQFFSVHAENPQARLMRQAAAIVRAGGVIVYPTDSCYALGFPIGDKAAVERVRAIRGLDSKHYFTLVCRNIAEVGKYARIDNAQFGILKSATPGCYTFILKADRQVPRRLQHPRRRTIGVRIPDHRVAQALLLALGEPLVSSTLLLPGDELPMTDALEIRERLEHRVDLILDAGACGTTMSTVIDLTLAAPQLLRPGKASGAVLGR